MRVLAALLVALSFFATHAAGEALARATASTVQDAPAQLGATGPEMAAIEKSDRRAEGQSVAPANEKPCQGGDCLFILPAVAPATHAVRPGIGAVADATGTGRPGRMAHPPPIA